MSAETKETKSLWGLMVCQFTGAFNDYALRWMIVLLAVQAGAVSSNDGNSLMQGMLAKAMLYFSIPMIIVCIPAAYIADKISKRQLIISMKFVEVLLMATVTYILYNTPMGGHTAFVILALMGLQSGLFSPAKYGIIPEVMPHNKLSSTNALIELLTMVAIIGGSAAGGLLKQGNTWMGAAFLTLLAIAGFMTSLRVPHVKAARSSADSNKFFAAFGEALGAMKNKRTLRLTILGSTFFYTVANLLIQNVSVFVQNDMGMEDIYTGLPMAFSGIGIVVGCVMAAKLSHNRVEMGIIPLGSTIIALLSCVFGFFNFSNHSPIMSMTLINMMMFAIGIGSGLLIVPMQSLLQWQSPKTCRGAVIALSNIFILSGTVLGSLLGTFLAQNGVSTSGIFVTIAFMTVAGMVWALTLLPQAFVRFVLLILTHSIYKIKVSGTQNVPEEGGALLVPNHVSLADGLFVIATVDRPVKFLVDSGFFHHPILRPIMRLLGCVPISSSGGPRVVLEALRRAGNYLDQGEVVCIFAEGQITRTGMMQPFQKGMERLVKGKDVPIIPVHLDRVWGSVFSHQGGGYLRKLPDRIPYPVTVSYGKALPTNTPVSVVRRKVHDLGQEAWEHRKHEMKPLHHEFIRQARKLPTGINKGMLSLAFADAKVPRVSRIKALAGTLALGKKLIPLWNGQDRVGILLPPSVGSALTNMAASMSDKTSVNLNYTAGDNGLKSAIEQSGLKTVVSSKEFMEAIKLELPEHIEMIWLDDLMPTISKGEKLQAMLKALLGSVKSMERYVGATRPVDIDDVATIIFSSGSTAEPKGVMLTHYNIASNSMAADQGFRATHNDRMLGILPLFHSFGYMAMWYATHHGVGVVFHPNPIDAAHIGELVQSYRISFLLATPTFLQIYMRRVSPAQFGSLRLVIAGAEKLPERLSNAFESHFGIRPLEGYGSTECAPAISMNTNDYRGAGFYQPGSRRGTVGQPLPGVSVSIVDPDSFEAKNPNEDGMIIVKGPNIMKGYLGKPGLTSEVIKDGWYVTGDMGALDEDGFLRITGRLTRFSKIGGEMVPHGAVEEALHDVTNLSEQTFAVTSVAYEKKGEKIIVIHCFEGNVPEVVEGLKTKGLPNLFIPAANCFYKVEALPLLGTGKLDLRQLKSIAEENFS